MYNGIKVIEENERVRCVCLRKKYIYRMQNILSGKDDGYEKRN